jgi:hypothetical protein
MPKGKISFDGLYQLIIMVYKINEVSLDLLTFQFNQAIELFFRC